MDAKWQGFRDHFNLLSDEALLAVNREELVPLAQQCLDEEIDKRGLRQAEPAPDEPMAGEDEVSPDEEDLTVLTTYDVAEEAEAARQTLTDADIHARLVSDP